MAPPRLPPPGRQPSCPALRFPPAHAQSTDAPQVPACALLEAAVSAGPMAPGVGVEEGTGMRPPCFQKVPSKSQDGHRTGDPAPCWAVLLRSEYHGFLPRI